ncbi:MAG: DUF4351 domain-containing protein [Bryobacteraceae bacterium]|nr:DUF4351 domain-containing protein [Bryobacteraceae bacterium]
MQHDVNLKKLFTQSARGLLRALTGGAITEWLNVELPRVNLPRMDLLGRVDRGGLANIEFQTTNEEDMAERTGVYHLETFRNRGEYPRQIVLYLGRAPLRMRNYVRSPLMNFEFPLIDIGELDGEQMAATGDLGDMMLAVLARVNDRQEMIRRVLDEIVKLEGKARETALEQLAILVGLRGLELEVVKEAKKYMPFVVDLMENQIFRDAVARGEALGEARGEARGEAKGEAKILTRLLIKRFGPLPEWVSQRLAGAAGPQLEEWSLRLLDAQSLEGVFD